jgi:hypothetical protein
LLFNKTYPRWRGFVNRVLLAKAKNYLPDKTQIANLRQQGDVF